MLHRIRKNKNKIVLLFQQLNLALQFNLIYFVFSLQQPHRKIQLTTEYKLGENLIRIDSLSHDEWSQEQATLKGVVVHVSKYGKKF